MTKLEIVNNPLGAKLITAVLHRQWPDLTFGTEDNIEGIHIFVEEDVNDRCYAQMIMVIVGVTDCFGIIQDNRIFTKDELAQLMSSGL